MMKLRLVLRDAQGALKHEEVRLGRESQKLLSEADIKSMEEENKTLQKHISFYFKETKNDLPDINYLQDRYDNLCVDIENISKEILKFNFSYRDKSKLTKFDEIIKLENELIAKDKSLYSVLLELESQLMEDKEILKQLKKDGVKNKKELEAKLSVLKKGKKQFDKMKFIFSVEGDLYNILNDTKSLRLTLFELVSEAKGGSLSVPEKKLWDRYKEELNILINKIQKYDSQLISLLKQKETIESSQEHICPKCKYIWKPGVSEEELKVLNQKINKLQNVIKELNVKREKLSEECENIDIRKEEINRFRSLAHSYPRLRNFWFYIAECEFLYSDPQAILNYYSIWEEEVENSIEIEKINHDIESIKITLKRLNEEKDIVNIEYLTKREKGIKERIEVILKDIEKTKYDIKELSKYKDDYLNLSDLISKLTIRMKELKGLEYQIIEGKIQSEINDRLNDTQVSLASNRTRKTEVETIAGIIKDLKNSIENLKSDIQSLSAIEETLSPNNGLIADTLGGFINVFINQLNVLIERVWEYDLKIGTCSNNDGELDYKFPFKVVGNDTPIRDISEGSTGQIEIIDFVFMITVMVYMDLMDFPLFLDEMGSSFDETHKSRLVMFIKWLLETQHCSQIWMVSHFASEHGGLTDAEICVLDGTNIAIPENSNLHVKMN